MQAMFLHMHEGKVHTLNIPGDIAAAAEVPVVSLLFPAAAEVPVVSLLFPAAAEAPVVSLLFT